MRHWKIFCNGIVQKATCFPSSFPHFLLEKPPKSTIGPYVEKLICSRIQRGSFPHTKPFSCRKRAFCVENHVESVGNFKKTHAALHKEPRGLARDAPCRPKAVGNGKPLWTGSRSAFYDFRGGTRLVLSGSFLARRCISLWDGQRRNAACAICYIKL